MIRVVTNSNGSGDWVVVQNGGRDGFEDLFSGHRITPLELASILEQLGHQVDVVAVTDEEMEENDY